ncbi:MAG: hypothetical protein QM731_06700 [Chitinophagaceae bacterium]
MKTVLIAAILCCSIIVQGQLADGLYKSNGRSFRQHYYLSVKNDSATLFGWEVVPGKDTVYFKSGRTACAGSNFTFNDFYFTKTRNTPDNLSKFSDDKSVAVSSALLHRHWSGIKQINGGIQMYAVNDIYDSRGDRFVFVKVK